MDRYRCIVVPPFRSQLTPKRACLLTTITWLIASVIFLPVALWFREQTTDNNLRICTLVFPKNDTVNVSLLFLVPTLLLSCIAPLTMFVYYYQQIFRKLNETKDRWRNNDKNKFGSNKPDVLRQQEEIRLNRHMRVIRILLLNVLVVLIMWLPITVIMFLIYVDGSRPNHDTNFFLRSHHFIWTLLIALLNTVVNPLLYGVMSENFRKCFLRMRFLSRQRKALTRQIFCDGGPGSSSSKTPTMVKTQFQFTNAISIIDWNGESFVDLQYYFEVGNSIWLEPVVWLSFLALYCNNYWYPMSKSSTRILYDVKYKSAWDPPPPPSPHSDDMFTVYLSWKYRVDL